jgi:hypothetical protein
MPGGQLKGPRSGVDAENLAALILDKLGYVIRVRREQDVGHDLICVLSELDGKILKAGPSFTVQVKANHHQIPYEQPYAVHWLENQELPFFVCAVNNEEQRLDLYSTWNVHNCFLWRAVKQVALVLDEPIPEDFTYPRDSREKQAIPLGKPVVSVSMEDIKNPASIRNLREVLRGWIELEQENIINSRVGFYFVVGSETYHTNEVLNSKGPWRIAFYYHPKNLNLCLRNYTRAAVSLRVTLGTDHNENLGLSSYISSLDQTIRTYWPYIEDAGKEALEQQGVKLWLVDEK